MCLSSNALLTAAGGTGNSNYIQSLDEPSLRNKLRDYTTNLLAFIQSNYPNATVEQILSGRQIIPSTNTGLCQCLQFPVYTFGGTMPVTNWNSLPTNMMPTLKITFAGTNYQWLMPQLHGDRIAITFDTNGL